jgi:hypothetical protein
MALSKRPGRYERPHRAGISVSPFLTEAFLSAGENRPGGRGLPAVRAPGAMGRAEAIP